VVLVDLTEHYTLANVRHVILEATVKLLILVVIIPAVMEDHVLPKAQIISVNVLNVIRELIVKRLILAVITHVQTAVVVWL